MVWVERLAVAGRPRTALWIQWSEEDRLSAGGQKPSGPSRGGLPDVGA